jgi:ATP-dependent Clp protease ATP-binding subunit ClpA
MMAGESFDIAKVTNLAKVKALMEARNSGKRKVVKENELLAALANRVRGQDEALAVIARAVSVGYATEAANNKRADFTSAVIVLTSNLDHEKCAEIHQGFPDRVARRWRFQHQPWPPHQPMLPMIGRGTRSGSPA